MHRTDLWDVWSLQLALAEGGPVEVGEPGVHLHISRSTLKGTQPLVGVLDQEPPDDIPELLHSLLSVKERIPDNQTLP